MKKIAIFLDNASNHAIYSRISGVFGTVYEEGLDVAVYLYRSRGAWKFDEIYNAGEYNIFRLPDLSLFDGFILIFNDLTEDRRDFSGWKACQDVIRRVRESGKPAISIGTRIEGIHHVGIDNITSMTAVIRHLTEMHRCRNFWFFMGPQGHRESEQRAQAIRDYLAGWDDRDYNEFFYYESFDSLCGEHGFSRFIEKYGNPPDAILCANDHIAIGVCEEAARRGYACPRDFLLTGFDNTDMASCHTPSLTTIDQRWPELGRVCVDYFRACWAGEDFPQSTIVYTQLIRRQSCGCETRTPEEAADLFNESIRQSMAQENFNRQLIRLENNLMRSHNVREIGNAFASMVSYLKCESISLVLDRRFYSEREQTELLKDSNRLREPGEGFFLKRGYPPNMMVAFTCQNGRVTASDVPADRLFADEDRKPAPRDYMFLPVHFGDRAAGYIVLAQAEHMIRNTYLVRAIQMLLSAIENHYIQNRLQSANQLLSRASITDAMTGFYNRLGYQEVAIPEYQKACQQGRKLAILFADMNGLKKINDRFGHENGDYAILSLAQAIRRSCPQDAFIARMGGDEFLILLSETGEDQIRSVIERIKAEVPLTEAAGKLPYPPTVSIGHIVSDASGEQTLDHYVNLSDGLMYEEKRKYKEQTGT
ncbi:MAG: GGDEF domain-containing protein [Lachnospiraceae bacterium]|nr:GGDEF domain-containing protein [Lachnospiraceae bacterium]